MSSTSSWKDGPRAWVLNLDAEQELEAPRGYTPSQAMQRIVAGQVPRLVGELILPGDVLVTAERLAADPQGLRGEVQGLSGHAWSPTPRARRLLDAVGVRPADAPGVEVLRRVNARAFAAATRAPLAGASFEKIVVGELETALAQVARPAELGWLVRRPYGAAGRGRRRLYSGVPDANELGWLKASLEQGPLVIEPFVEVTVEYTRSGLVRPDGSVVVAAPCFQATTAEGAWTRTAAAAPEELRAEDDRRLGEAAQHAGEALAAAGYFGPFGIDAFRHRLPGRSGDVLNPMSEINARYTMDWRTGGMKG